MAKNLDATDVTCFGFTSPMATYWRKLIQRGVYTTPAGKKLFEKSMKEDIDLSYYRLATVTLKDLDTDTQYYISFINGKKMWDVEIVDSPEAEVSPEEKAELFSSAEFKRILARAADIIEDAKVAFEESAMELIKTGELLKVDEIRCEAIQHWLSDVQLMRNFKTGKYIK